MRWLAKVKSAQGALVEVSVEAVDCVVALVLLKQLYGARSVIFGPWRTGS
jgi:hypothetical protein